MRQSCSISFEKVTPKNDCNNEQYYWPHHPIYSRTTSRLYRWNKERYDYRDQYRSDSQPYQHIAPNYELQQSSISKAGKFTRELGQVQ
jgi:hypothetical protein